ncbi:hypothetical protein Tco_0072500 [Tanacetum coccineum]
MYGAWRQLESDRMFPEELEKIERYVGGLPDMIHGNIVASKPKTMQEAIEMVTELMDKRVSTIAEKQEECAGLIHQDSIDWRHPWDQTLRTLPKSRMTKQGNFTQRTPQAKKQSDQASKQVSKQASGSTNAPYDLVFPATGPPLGGSTVTLGTLRRGVGANTSVLSISGCSAEMRVGCNTQM